MKKCRFCAEEIKDQATLCKHCGESVSEKPHERISGVSGGRSEEVGQVSETASAERTKGIVMLVIGLLLTFFNLTRESGFNNGSGPQAMGGDIANLLFWIAGIVLILKGIKKIISKSK